ncbi:histone protein [Streptomyces kronopolitis]|uniref:histone protein n=1 Tax=Streptomyces kronopolitis TaxID=1612435 RepID=UPI0020C100F2|nr:histone protein [Streptomyces kronopolitis]MCL6298878.1 histone protein [Streptomyces kronopolitis]
METDTKVTLAAALAAGYVLGRTKKGKLAIGVASMVVGQQLSPRELIGQALRRLAATPQAEQLIDQVRGELLESGRAALSATADRSLGNLAGALQKRTSALQEPLEEEEPDEDEEPAEDEDEEFAEDEEEPSDEEDEGEEEEEEDEEEQPSRRRTGKSSADRARTKKSPGKKPPAKKPPAKKPPAKKAPAKKAASGKPAAKKQATKKPAAKKTAAKKTAAKKTAAKKTSSRTSRRR